MNYTTHDLEQGSPEWHAYRDTVFNASQAAAMLGISSYQSRLELIRELATGIKKEYDTETLKRFAEGHRAEALARPIAESILGEELYPVTVSAEFSGPSRPLSASMDGITIDDRTTFEHKSLNADLEAALKANTIPEEYHPQMEQGLMITGASACLFMASKWDESGGLLAEYHAWYYPNQDLRERIIAGWALLESDVRNYQHVEPAARVVADTIPDLPALAVEIVGTVVSSNLTAWSEVVIARIGSIKTDLKTDQDFANGEATVKFLEEGEKRIKLVKEQAQASATDIDTLFRALDDIAAKMKSTRTTLAKSIEERKRSIREEIALEGRSAIQDHLATLNKRLERVQMPLIAVDFAGAMKGKRTVDSLRAAMNAELTRARLAASAMADKIEINIKRLDKESEYNFLFNDFARLVLKEPEDLDPLIRARIAEHKANEERRLAAERERIAVEERANAQREAEETMRRQREAEAAQAKAAADAAAKIEADRKSALGLGAVLDAAAPAQIAQALSTEPAAQQAPTGSNPPPASRPAAVAASTGSRGARLAESRPTDEMIIGFLSVHFRVHESKVIEWLLAMDLNAASERMVKQEFAA